MFNKHRTKSKSSSVMSEYLENVLSPEGIRKNVLKVVKTLRPHIDNFDTIAFRGVSGAMVAPAVAAILHKQVCVIRKDEKRHSRQQSEGFRDVEKYVIVDDMVATGTTIQEIMSRVQRSHSINKKVAECYGVVLYAWNTRIGNHNTCKGIGTRVLSCDPLGTRVMLLCRDLEAAKYNFNHNNFITGIASWLDSLFHEDRKDLLVRLKRAGWWEQMDKSYNIARRDLRIQTKGKTLLSIWNRKGVKDEQ